MRAAVAIGVAVDGHRQQTGTRVDVEHGSVTLDCRWTAGPTSLRGAVVAALGGRAHVDLHGHVDDGTTRQSRATVLYRAGSVYAFGPRAIGHLASIARIESLCLPTGETVPVTGASLTSVTTSVGIERERWHRYELATPYYPSTVGWARRPRTAGPERAAWAGSQLAASVRQWLEDVGVTGDRPVHVQWVGGQDVPVSWRERDHAVGFVGRWMSNARLPDGIGLGQHVSEGWGEVRRC